MLTNGKWVAYNLGIGPVRKCVACRLDAGVVRGMGVYVHSPEDFIREDLFEDSRAVFPDASKLAAQSVSLSWTVEDLYRMLIRHMVGHSERLRNGLEQGLIGFL